MTDQDSIEVADVLVELKYIQPKVWRKVQLPTCYNLRHLHLVIHQLFGWPHNKEHRFFINYEEYAPSEDISDELFASSVRNEKDKDISSLINDDTTIFTYTNSFSDKGYWEHIVKIDNIQIIEDGAQGLIVLDGDCASPVENTVGNASYNFQQKVLADRYHPEHQLVSALFKSNWKSLEYSKTELTNKLAELDLD